MTPKKILLFSIGPIGLAVLGFLILPLTTWIFEQGDVGRISMLQTCISFSILLFSLGLDQTYVREFNDCENHSTLIKTAILPGLFLLIIMLTILLFCDNFLSKMLFDSSSLKLSLVIAFIVMSAFISRFLSLILRMDERGLAFSISQLCPKILFFCILCLYPLLPIESSLDNLVIINAIAYLSGVVILIWNVRIQLFSSLQGVFDVKLLRKMFAYGFPLIFSGVAFWGLTGVDKLFLRMFSSYQELGLYSVSVSFSSAVAVLQSVFSAVWIPTVYKWVAQIENENIVANKVYTVARYILLAVIVLFCLSGLFSWIIPFVLPEEYSLVKWVFISCIGYPLFYVLSESTSVGLGIVKKTHIIMLASFCALVINVLLNYILVPKFGAIGAATSSCFAFFIFFIIKTEFSNRLWVTMPRMLLYSYTSILTIISILSSLIGKELGFLLYIIWSGVLFSAIYFFREEVGKIKSFIFGYLNRNRQGV